MKRYIVTILAIMEPKGVAEVYDKVTDKYVVEHKNGITTITYIGELDVKFGEILGIVKSTSKSYKMYKEVLDNDRNVG